MIKHITKEEINAFQARYEDTQAIEILIPDMCGVLRGKRIGIDSRDKLHKGGVMMPGSTYFLDTTGRNCETLTIGVDDGDPDFPCLGAAGTMAPIPWNNTPMAQIIVDMMHHDGRPYFGNPRHRLSLVIERLKKMGLTPVVAVELEFYLLDPKLNKRGIPRAARLPGRTQHQTTTQVYGIEELYDFHEFLYDIEEAAQAQNIPVDTATSEYAPSQYEVNLRHVADPLLAADYAMLLKRLIKGVARKHNMVACFMAKPFADQAGNGMHLHVSMIDEKGKNIFAGPPDPASGLPIGDNLKYAIGGLAKTMPDSIAIFAPNANSFRRLQSGSYAPINTSWGVDNRTVSLRVPYADENSIRLEHRVAGADANPYLVMAAVLAGIHHGMVHKINPGEPATGNAYKRLEKGELPLRWWQALDSFGKSDFIADYFSSEYQDIYELARSFESDQFNNFIPPLDYEWYLSAV